MQILKNRVIKSAEINWRQAEWFQPPGFKDINDEDIKLLLTSFSENDIFKAFSVWFEEATGILWILDGCHRKKFLLLGEEQDLFIAPEKLTANFIDCKNRQEAAKVVLGESARYARITGAGMEQFLRVEDLQIDDVASYFDLSGHNFDFADFNMNADDFSGGDGFGDGSGSSPKDPNSITIVLTMNKEVYENERHSLDEFFATKDAITVKYKS